MNRATTLLGVDTGGTFTDFVCLKSGELLVHKVLSTPDRPEAAILKGIWDLGLAEALVEGSLSLIHGTTVATNAALQGKGRKTVYITNAGLGDVLHIGRQTRDELYNLTPDVTASPFEDELTLEVSARISAHGQRVSGFAPGELEKLKQAVDQLAPASIAINLLFSFLDASDEMTIEQLFSNDYFVSRSSTILPEYKEYERGVTTWVNSWIGPLINDYLLNLQQQVSPSPVAIMQSSGLTISANLAAKRAVNLLLSGPAGGLSAAVNLGKLIDEPNLMTFDMGGTSSDVSLLEGDFQLTNSGRIGNFPIGVPMADIHTIGAGGGSIAYLDQGGLLNVGPQSAGATPGPACYGQGGHLPTVTDANLVLGKLQADTRLAGGLALDIAAAKTAIEPLARTLDQTVEEVALGIIRIANEHMVQALRVISIERGFDPRQFMLACFGGAGGLHLCALAEALEMKRAVVPMHSGVLSALGMLTTRPGREMVKTYQCLLKDQSKDLLIDLIDALRTGARLELAEEGITETLDRASLDLRYEGQSYTINVAFDENLPATADRFHQLHKKQYGHALDRPIELVNCRLHMEARQPAFVLPDFRPRAAFEPDWVNLPEFAEPVQRLSRMSLQVGQEIPGPALIVEDHATTVINPGWKARLDRYGNLLLNFG